MSVVPRFAELDTLRFVFALLIVPGHLIGWLGPISNAGLAVDFFFILSGFVLTHQLTVKKSDQWNFIVQRFARLWPLHIVTMVVCLLTIPKQGTWLYLFAQTFLLHDTGIVPKNTLNVPSWSISAEFLIGVALLYPIVRYRLTWLALVVAVACTIFLIGYADGRRIDQLTIQRAGYVATGLIRCAIGTCIGICLYRAYQRLNNRDWNAPLITIVQCGLLVVVFVIIGTPTEDNGFRALGIAGASALILSMTIKSTIFTRMLAHPAVSWLGALSFGIYMWHYPLMQIFQRAHWLPWHRALLDAYQAGELHHHWVDLSIFGLTLLATSLGTYHLIEMPAKRLITSLARSSNAA